MTKSSTCQACGSTFTWRSKNGRERKYCSRPCFYQATQGSSRQVANPALLEQMDCIACGSPFTYRPTQNQRSRKYCSRTCYTTHWPTQRPKRPEIWLTGTCQYATCGTEYTYRRGGGRSGKYCSADCYNSDRALAAAEKAAGTAAPLTKPCLTCGGPVAHWPSTAFRKFCSTQCRGIGHQRGLTTVAQFNCQRCSASYTPSSSRQRWCITCVPDKNARGRMIRYGITEPQWQEMISRFDGKCWICREWPAQCVEHCHETGRIRGAACRSCNTGLHYVDRPGWFEAARTYLEEVSQHCGQPV